MALRTKDAQQTAPAVVRKLAFPACQQVASTEGECEDECAGCCAVRGQGLFIEKLSWCLKRASVFRVDDQARPRG